jgi:hypothetical protein
MVKDVFNDLVEQFRPALGVASLVIMEHSFHATAVSVKRAAPPS